MLINNIMFRTHNNNQANFFIDLLNGNVSELNVNPSPTMITPRTARYNKYRQRRIQLTQYINDSFKERSKICFDYLNGLKEIRKEKHAEIVELIMEKKGIFVCDICFYRKKWKVECPTCKNKVCLTCTASMQKCPFCRTPFQ